MLESAERTLLVLLLLSSEKLLHFFSRKAKRDAIDLILLVSSMDMDMVCFGVVGSCM